MRSAAGVHPLVVMILECGMILCDVAGSNSGELEDCCTVHFKQQSLKSARAISSQYFTCNGERKKGRRSPMLLLRQGRRPTSPPSTECEFQGPDARDVFLCSPCGWLTLDPEKPVPQTADTCSSSANTTRKERESDEQVSLGAERICLLMCLRKIP